MRFKNVLLIAALAVSLTLAVLLFARSPQFAVTGPIMGIVPTARPAGPVIGIVPTAQPSGPVFAGGRGGLGGEVLANPVQSTPMTGSGDNTDQGE